MGEGKQKRSQSFLFKNQPFHHFWCSLMMNPYILLISVFLQAAPTSSYPSLELHHHLHQSESLPLLPGTIGVENNKKKYSLKIGSLSKTIIALMFWAKRKYTTAPVRSCWSHKNVLDFWLPLKKCPPSHGFVSAKASSFLAHLSERSKNFRSISSQQIALDFNF